MEVGQRLGDSAALVVPLHGFKPCCHGSRSAATVPGPMAASSRRFQTLLSWNRSAASISRDEAWDERFQTLLSWMSVSGIDSRVLRRWPKYVSNLVVMDLGQRPGLEDIWATGAMMFQTLLSWISVSGSSAIAKSVGQTEVSNLVVVELGQRQWREDSKRMDEFCFKPCCRGSRSAAVKVEISTRREVFQTLLSWMSVSGHLSIPLQTIPSRFQTLLSWKSVSGWY